MSRRNRQRTPGRRKPFREVKRRLLVVCEGQNTEPQYLKGYARHLNNPSVVVEVDPKTGDPRKVVEIAKQRRSQAFPGDYDAFWCVFDRDEHPRFHEAVDMARANGLSLAVSNPCFELWLLLHFRDTPGMRDRHTLQKMMKGYVQDYDKKVRFADYANQVGDAEQRAARLEADSASPSRPNPSTGVHHLTRSIRRAPAEETS